jgi:hypothetical protein
VETLAGSWGKLGLRPVDLVFRTVGERTSELALNLALKHIQPHRVHIVRNVKPFKVAVRRMLQIAHDCNYVVYLDADCLIMESLRPFLDAIDMPYVDCYGHDRFRGPNNRGAHITRIDVVNTMRQLPEPVDDIRYTLFPESHLRNVALFRLGFKKRYKTFRILHDHFQWHVDVFAKNALAALRNRASFYETADFYAKSFQAAMSEWGDDAEFRVARLAVQHALSAVPQDADPALVDRYIRELPDVARSEVGRLGLHQSDRLSLGEVEHLIHGESIRFGQSPIGIKVFGISMWRCGARSLTKALHMLGIDTVHDPTDTATLETITRGDADFPVLNYYDGLTGIPVALCYQDLDRRWPGAKFVLLVRDEDSLVCSFRRHCGRIATLGVDADQGRRQELQSEPLRTASSCLTWLYPHGALDEVNHFFQTYRRHVQNVLRYFAGRENDLLVMNIIGGDGYERLADFLGVPALKDPFPHEGRDLTDYLVGL